MPTNREHLLRSWLLIVPCRLTKNEVLASLGISQDVLGHRPDVSEVLITSAANGERRSKFFKTVTFILMP